MTQFDPSATLALLEAAPGRIAAVTRGFSAQQLIWQPAAESWSVNEVLAHLRACADVWGGSIERILHEDNPTFRYVSPRAWIRKTNYPEVDFPVGLLAFAKQREDLLTLLRPLRREGWLRKANVKATTLREETVLSYAQRLAEHEAGHFDQIDRILQAGRPRG